MERRAMCSTGHYLSRWRRGCTVGRRRVDHLFYHTLVDRSISRKRWAGLDRLPADQRRSQGVTFVWAVQAISRTCPSRSTVTWGAFDHWVCFGSTVASASGADKWSFSVAARCSCAPSSGLVER